MLSCSLFFPPPLFSHLQHQHQHQAYPFASKPEGWSWRITKTGEKTKDVGEDGKEKGKKAKKSKLERVEFDPGVVRLIGRVKSWAVFHNPSVCSNLQRTYKMVLLSCALSNFFVDHGDINQMEAFIFSCSSLHLSFLLWLEPAKCSG